MTVLPAFERAGQSFCVPSMALILLVQVQSVNGRIRVP